MQNAIKRIKHAREVGKKIQVCIIIQRKFIEFMYKPDGMTAKQLAIHFNLLWGVREEMRHVNTSRNGPIRLKFSWKIFSRNVTERRPNFFLFFCRLICRLAANRQKKKEKIRPLFGYISAENCPAEF